MHLIGLALKKSRNVPWIVDIRDPWSKLDFLDNFRVTQRNRAKYENLESAVLNNCDLVLATSYSMKELLQAFDHEKYVSLTNGFDQDDFKKVSLTSTDQFSIFHAGLLNDPRNPEMLWEALAELCQDSEAFANQLEIRLAGTVDPAVAARIQNDPVLGSKLHLMGYLSHEEVIRQYAQSSVLLLLINNTYNAKVNIPGKLFEYLAIGRPILAIGSPDADAIRIVKECKAGFGLDYNEKEKLKEVIWQLFQEKNSTKPDKAAIQRFSRRALTRELVTLLNDNVFNNLNG